VIIGRPIRWFY